MTGLIWIGGAFSLGDGAGLLAETPNGVDIEPNRATKSPY